MDVEIGIICLENLSNMPEFLKTGCLPPTHIPNTTLKKIADFNEPSRNLPGIKIYSCILKKRNGMKNSSYTNSEQFVKIGHS